MCEAKEFAFCSMDVMKHRSSLSGARVFTFYAGYRKKIHATKR